MKRCAAATRSAAPAALELNNHDAARDFLEGAPREHRDWEWRHFTEQLDNAWALFQPAHGAVSVFALAPTGDRFAYALAGSSEVRVRVPGAASDLAVFVSDQENIASLAFSNDGSLVAAGADLGAARVWRISDGRQVAVIDDQDSADISLLFSPDGSRLVAISKDENARVFELASGRRFAAFPAASAQMSPDGRRVVTMSNGNAYLRDATTGVALRELNTPGKIVTCAAFSPDGRRIATGNYYPTSEVCLWGLEQEGPPVILSGHKNTVLWVAFSPDGRLVASSSSD
jgi:WD40 repeat protein